MSSILSVPANSEKMLLKARSLKVRRIIFDLEDSVPEGEKVIARNNIVHTATQQKYLAPELSIRINALEDQSFYDDIAMLSVLNPSLITIIVLPKINNVEEISQVASLLPRDVNFDVQIETALSMLHLPEIASHPRVQSLSFGPLDFIASVGIPFAIASERPPEVEEALRFTLFKIITAAHAFKKTVYDGPDPRIDDLVTFRNNVEIARNLGADGKWVIHPNQISICNEVFEAPLTTQIPEILDVGSLKSHGEMIDLATQRIIENRKKTT
jgi:citrate lyase subunit beta/citryl-CoA lyase